MKYSVKALLRHSVETGEEFFEESIIMLNAGSFDEAYEKAKRWYRESGVRESYENTCGQLVNTEVVSFADCFSVYDDEDVIEVYSSITMPRGGITADTIVSVHGDNCSAEEMYPLRHK